MFGVNQSQRDIKEDQAVPSPTATGGAGEHFEQHVDAFALALLLVGATPPILTNTSLVEVSLQTLHLGWKTDDLLVIGESGTGVRRKLAAQVKRTLSIRASDDDCRATIERFWDDFKAEDRFDERQDRLAIISLHGTSVLLQSFGSLLECARAAVDAPDFFRRLDAYLSKKSKEQNQVIRDFITQHNGSEPADEEYWRFLKVIHVLSFDLNTATAMTESLILSLLAYVVTDAPDALGAARATWTSLLDAAGRGRPEAKTYRRDDLPSDVLAHHSTLRSAEAAGLQALTDHGRTVRNGIRSTIGSGYEIDQSETVLAMLDALTEHQVVIITGAAGSGKSATAKKGVEQVEADYPVLAFQAVEFATAHIDETLAKAQTALNAQRLISTLAGHDRIVILIESLERLLEHSIRDAFSHLLQLAHRNPSVQVLITCRDYSLETVRSAFLVPLQVSHAVLDVGVLSDEDLEGVQANVPQLEVALGNSSLRTLLRTPYFLEMASHLQWEDGAQLQTTRSFREKCWKELIRVDRLRSAGLPQRRENTFVNIAVRRARELSPFVSTTDDDPEVLDALVADSLLARPPSSSSLYAPEHDVLEDWAVMHWIETEFSKSEDPQSTLADCVSGYPALRRGLRRWLSERIELDPDSGCDFVLSSIQRTDLPAYFRDDCLVCALLSGSADAFIASCGPKIEAGDIALLRQIIHMLRVACKQSPQWLTAPGLPSFCLVPAGPGWPPTLRVVARIIKSLLPSEALLILGLVEDWARQVDWRTPYPPGSTEAGLIVDKLLPHFEDYGFEDTRKRALEVALKIPRSVPEFPALLTRAESANYEDRTASDLADLVLGSLSGSQACRDYPRQVISLANTRLRTTEEELRRDHSYSSFRVDRSFGMQEHGVSDFFPASALQGPFGALLRSNPREGVDFIVDLLNHAADWYGNQRAPGEPLEPAWQIPVPIPDSEQVEQWMNSRLYCLYRGATVGPYSLQCALMALESWLLTFGDDQLGNPEPWLLHILKSSNNVMATAVVASVCISNPDKSGKAAIALLSSRDLIQMDRLRMSSESASGFSAFDGMNPSHKIHEQERKTANSRKHRHEDLESLAILLQLTERRDEVSAIIDEHRGALPEQDEQDDETRLWRLALHRMDVRGYKPMESPETPDQTEDAQESEKQVYFGPGEIEPDVQTMMDERSRPIEERGRHLELQMRARAAWDDAQSEEAAAWHELLKEAQQIERELEEPDRFCRSGPGLIAAVCIRDRLDDLDEAQLDWCVARVELEVLRNATSPDSMSRHSRGGALWADRPCASVVGLLAADERTCTRELLATALTHPVDEVSAYAYLGVGALLSDEHKDLILECAAAAALRTRTSREYRQAEEDLPYSERTEWVELEARSNAVVRDAMENGSIDVQSELSSLELDARESATSIHMILPIFQRHPAWSESREFFMKVASWLAHCWNRDNRRNRDRGNRNYALEGEASRSLAGFAIGLPSEEALRTCAPLIEELGQSPREVADFIEHLILAADGGSPDDCFWDLWNALADRAASSDWTQHLGRERPSGESCIYRLFLNTHWKEGTKHWARLEDHAQDVAGLTEFLPAETVCVAAYCQFLHTVGQHSLPGALRNVAALFARGNADRIATDSNVSFYLENLLPRFVYLEPNRVKSDAQLRAAVLSILEALIAAGSSSAYRMRDDFVTP